MPRSTVTAVRSGLALVPAAIMAVAVMTSGCGSHPAQVPDTTGAAAQIAAPAHKAAPRHQEPASRGVFLAEGQDVNGTYAQRPRCTYGCPLSGDGTIVLYDMRWPAWKKTAATGTGTETIQSCSPSCSAGRQYKVKVVVMLSRPVRDCSTRTAFWTRARFRFPRGLHGAPAPLNPWIFSGVAAQAARSCQRVRLGGHEHPATRRPPDPGQAQLPR